MIFILLHWFCSSLFPPTSTFSLANTSIGNVSICEGHIRSECVVYICLYLLLIFCLYFWRTYIRSECVAIVHGNPLSIWSTHNCENKITDSKTCFEYFNHAKVTKGQGLPVYLWILTYAYSKLGDIYNCTWILWRQRAWEIELVRLIWYHGQAVDQKVWNYTLPYPVN